MTHECDEPSVVGTTMRPGPHPRAEQVVFPLRRALVWIVVVELVIVVAIIVDISEWLG